MSVGHRHDVNGWRELMSCFRGIRRFCSGCRSASGGVHAAYVMRSVRYFRLSGGNGLHADRDLSDVRMSPLEATPEKKNRLVSCDDLLGE